MPCRKALVSARRYFERRRGRSEISFVTLCVGVAAGGRVRGEDVVKDLHLTAEAGWISGYLEGGTSPVMEDVLKGRASANFVLDREGRVVHSRIAPELINEILRALPSSRGGP
jgi:hypothetical protein